MLAVQRVSTMQAQRAALLTAHKLQRLWLRPPCLFAVSSICLPQGGREMQA